MNIKYESFLLRTIFIVLAVKVLKIIFTYFSADCIVKKQVYKKTTLPTDY
ncbi:hypothetical protein IWX80_002636 [Flavobacterium sp. CAN_S2]